MRRRYPSPARITAAFCLFVSLVQTAFSADFAVATRDDVLILASRIQATQFLTHATFGATATEINSLANRMRQIGTVAAAGEWIDNQTNEAINPPSLHLPKVEQILTDDFQFWSISTNSTIGFDHAPGPRRGRSNAWWHNAIARPDQLRQKAAWALSQIFPVGDSQIASFNNDTIEATVAGGPTGKPRYFGMTNFYDIFVQNAFSNYRQILGRVTYHGIMGDWLSYRGNRRAQGGVFPDENYAREVMQLFSIGLYLLSDDGVLQTNAQGAIPTYDADDIREYAEVFTGLGFGSGTYSPSNTTLNPYSPYQGAVSTNPNGSIKYQVPMRMAPSQHDRSTKNLLNGLMLTNPGGINAVHTESTANTEINAALDGLFNHQSCPPFIVQRLIQRFVKSNPSRSYVSRVVSTFKNNGQGIRGDLKAVVRAILLDPEAWQPIRVQYVRAPVNRFVVTTMGTEDSRLQEPVLNYTRITRFFNGTAEYQKASGGSFSSPTVINNDFRLPSRDAEFEQSPYEAPSVFNFYLADYQPAGDLVSFVPSSRIPNGAIAAPEFQIVNAISANNSRNFLRALVISEGRREGVYTIGDQFKNSADVFTTILESTRIALNYDFSVEQSLAVSPTGIESLLERLDLYLCGGTLSNAYKSKLRTELLEELALAGGTGNVSASEALDIAKGAILAIITSPSFLVTE